jgi:agmatinase
MVAAVERKMSAILKKNKFCVTLGGEHSITPGAVYAHAKRYKKLSVLQFDAHTDMRDSYHGSKNNHACAMARVSEVCPVVDGKSPA